MAEKKSNKLTGMLNEELKCVDLYIPRKCDYTNKLLSSKDRASVQINIADIDENGKALKTSQTVIVSGYLRQKGQGAYAFEAILRDRKILPIVQL